MTVYKNGLMPEQLATCKEIFSKVNVCSVCKQLNIKQTTLSNVLRDKSDRIDLLKQAKDVANLQIEERKKLLTQIPSTTK